MKSKSMKRESAMRTSERSGRGGVGDGVLVVGMSREMSHAFLFRFQVVDSDDGVGGGGRLLGDAVGGERVEGLVRCGGFAARDPA